MARPAGEEAQSRRRGESPAASRLLVSFQYVHVQLGGGAPWGFTLRGGLEHGEPLIVSKVEDGGKAALSQKMRPGDELVNINGTPLYGSRQEALILIKGSYRTLKMIIRRRNVPVIRPHSWHLAKLSEVRTETAAMHFPADAFSLSWHSGCDTSDLPLPWNPLSRHCSTDKSSSLGSMESLDQPGQTYYEGSLSPIDQAMYQNKRDSAYSSFSASSNASDSALRPEENSSTEYVQQGQLLEPRYLQTGSDGSETTGTVSLPFPASQLSPSTRPASCTQEGPFPGSAKAFAPPQPPVRQDSLRACNPSPASTETQGASPQADSLHPKGRWTSDISLSVHSRGPEGTGGQLASASHTKESLPTDQYYLLSSHAEGHPPMERGAQSMESLLNEEGGVAPPEEPAQRMDSKESEADLGGRSHLSPFPWKDCWSGHLAHRHSAPEQLLAAQLQALKVAHSPEGPHWTVSPLHVESKSPRTQESWQTQGPGRQSPPGQAQDPDLSPVSGEGSWTPESCHTVQERPRSASVELPSSPSMQPSGPEAVPSMDALTVQGGQDGDGSRPATRKGGSAQHRSAQMRRRSDRFATNLRNEIQWRKAQLQKAKGSVMLLCGEEPVQETEEPPDSPTAPAPVPPAFHAESRPHRTAGPKRWGSELSVLRGDVAPQSPSWVPPEPKWEAPLPEPEKTMAALPLPSGGRGRWRWSPEHKLQPHSPSPQGPELGSPSRPPEESGLLPFADRRKFFEETSKAPASAHVASRHGRPGGLRPRGVEQNAFQPVSSEHRDQRRHSMDHSYGPPSSPPVYPEFRPEVSGFYKPLARHRDCECWRSLPCACATREACAYCCGERCPTLLQRNMPVPSSHCTHHCHPRPWARCTDCCCPAQHKLLEEGGPWQARKTYPPEFPVDDWEPPAMNRKNSQSMSELAQQKMGFVRVGHFWPCSENVEPEWAPFCRALSTHSLSWDRERPGQAVESQACGASRRQRQEAPLAKLEELPFTARKKGPPPPRPPPPKWEKYHPRRASHHQLLPTEAGLSAVPEDPRASSQISTDVARQRSQSLPLEQLWGDAAQEPQPRPRGSALPREHGDPHCYCRGSPRGTPEWPTPDLSGESDSSRPASSLAEEEKPEPLWNKEQNAVSSRGPELPQASPASLSARESESAQEGAGEESCHPGTASPAPPFRLNSEELMRDVAGRDRSLAGVLNPASGLVTAAEVMSDLFSPSECDMWKGQDWQPQAAGKGLPERHPAQPASPTSGGTSCSAYYNLSSGKAELLNKMKELPGASAEEEEEPDHDLARKKVQLIESISRKLAVLQEAQRGLQDDINANIVLGKEVESHVKVVCKPHEFEKFRLFIGDLDKVVNLLLSLSGRLARVENALGSLDSDAPEEEKLALLEKKRQLTTQLEDAKELQEHVAQRERVFFASVSRCLPSEQLQDYQHFVRMKSGLAIQQRQLDDKIKLGEEQLRCLRESLRRVPRDC
ncbi:PREDICTED: protein Shroom4 [Gekko japonicus]|uniref:Protein Shroom4 n=1 Tax=Gekko japonicus TaxID=146911 RepID=A0ABM1JSI4_GEKJA|nr:PREDICTED: protein Shroom4 [Gekko japonicus]